MWSRDAKRILIAITIGSFCGAAFGALLLPASSLISDGYVCFLDSWTSCTDVLRWSLLMLAPVGAFFGLTLGTPLFYYLVWARKARGMSRSRSARS